MSYILSFQYGDYIFTTDWTSKAIERYSKHNGAGHTIIQNNIEALMNIHVVAADRQTGNNGEVHCMLVIWFAYHEYSLISE